MPAGRPSDFTKEIADDICELVSLGDNLNRICKADDMPAQSTVYKWLLEQAEFSEKYARARSTRADTRSDRIDDYCRSVLDGELEPNAAKVIIDAEKWQAGREAPRRYGDKLDLNHGGQEGAPAIKVSFVD